MGGKYAVIDIGTNSTRMMLATYIDDKPHAIEKRLITTRIGERTPDGNKLSEDGIARTLNALDNFCAIARNAQVDEVLCYATSAVREAENSSEFIDAAKNRLNLDIDVISGDTEAEIAFVGALGKDGDGALIDIGGGSTEFIYAKGGVIRLKGSVPIGCVKLNAMLNDDVDGHIAARSVFRECPTEYAALNRRGQYNLKQKNAKALMASMRRFGGPVYAVGGAATTLCALAAGLNERYDGRIVHNRELTHGEARQILHELGGMLTPKRAEIPILKDRADIICFGASILLTCMDALDARSVIVSDSDGLDGYLIKTMNARASGDDARYA